MKVRFDLEDGDPKTLQAIGEELGSTRERVRQIEAKMLKQLCISEEILALQKVA